MPFLRLRPPAYPWPFGNPSLQTPEHRGSRHPWPPRAPAPCTRPVRLAKPSEFRRPPLSPSPQPTGVRRESFEPTTSPFLSLTWTHRQGQPPVRGPCPVTIPGPAGAGRYSVPCIVHSSRRSHCADHTSTKHTYNARNDRLPAVNHHHHS